MWWKSRNYVHITCEFLKKKKNDCESDRYSMRRKKRQTDIENNRYDKYKTRITRHSLEIEHYYKCMVYRGPTKSIAEGKRNQKILFLCCRFYWFRIIFLQLFIKSRGLCVCCAYRNLCWFHLIHGRDYVGKFLSSRFMALLSFEWLPSNIEINFEC